MVEYYEVDITCTGEESPGNFRIFNEETKIFDTPEEVIAWLKETYSHAKRQYVYAGDIKEPCGYAYSFENCDWSHAPVEKWNQKDWVTVSKVHSEIAFEEIKHEIPEKENK